MFANNPQLSFSYRKNNITLKLGYISRGLSTSFSYRKNNITLKLGGGQ